MTALLADAEAAAIAAGAHTDPFSILGVHPADAGWIVRAFVPGAGRLSAIRADGSEIAELAPAGACGVFAARLADHPGAYRLRATRGAERWDLDEPYRFGPVLGALDEHLISEGRHERLWQALGAHPIDHEGAAGVHFAVWAPSARRVSVIGDFNDWDGRRHVMRWRGTSGIAEIFLPGLTEGTRYKFEIIAGDGALLPEKADPMGLGAEPAPSTCSVVRSLAGLDWDDAAWMEARAARHRPDAPISIYEVHLASWQHDAHGRPLSWDALAERLVPYVADLGFTHIETLPISEHPFDGSWGYQPVGLFAPTSRHGDLAGFRRFVAACHRAGLGLILDWVPGHFPADPHGLARFDGTALYEHEDPREGFHPDWNTLIFNFGRREVANFLVSNALYWLEEHHVDALRVDAVASMLYRDYSRAEGDWVPNAHGGRENLEAVAFLQRLNTEAYGRVPSAMTIAEESTAWPAVTRPVHDGGLGFGFKWNMGWMNDTLRFMATPHDRRAEAHHLMTFGLHYAFSENFVLPLSHDEVVHGKGSLLARMPGDEWQRFANLRAYLAFMWAHPGKKLLFMGGEFAQPEEWDHRHGPDWGLAGHGCHAGVRRLVRDLNALYRAVPALHRGDAVTEGFEWIDGSATGASVLAWLRCADGVPAVLCVFNFSPQARTGWRIGVPAPGRWAECLNTDAASYGGGDAGNLGGVTADPVPAHGRAFSLALTLPPLSGLVFLHDVR